ncbi:MAG: hypothetical protein ACREO5_03695 [Candidatus Binatia bacterium]
MRIDNVDAAPIPQLHIHRRQVRAAAAAAVVRRERGANGGVEFFIDVDCGNTGATACQLDAAEALVTAAV